MSAARLEFVAGISGASGSALAIRFLAALAGRSEVGAVHVVVSERAILVAQSEIDGKISAPGDLVARAGLDASAAKKIRLHDNEALAAPISSGSYPVAGMAIVPCSAGTLGALASGTSRGLLQRAGDVALKERRRLVLAFRESPLSLIHIENLRAVTLSGAIVAPPVPPYYLRGATVETYLDHSVNRILDLLGLPPERDELRWGKGKKRRARTDGR